MKLNDLQEGILDRKHDIRTSQKLADASFAKKKEESEKTEKEEQERIEVMNWVRKNGFSALVSDYDPKTGYFTFKSDKAKFAFENITKFLTSVGKEFGWDANSGSHFPDDTHIKGNQFWLFWD